MKRHNLFLLLFGTVLISFFVQTKSSETDQTNNEWIYQSYIQALSYGPALLVKPDSSTVPADTRVSFFCRADGNPIPSVVWKWNGQPVTDPRFTTKTLTNGLSTLRLEPVNLEDSNSTVSCTADNGVGTPIKAEATLTVLPEDDLQPGFPAIEAHPVLKSVEQGRTAYITCRVKGDPRPRVLWLRDLMPIDIRSNSRYSVSTLGNPDYRENIIGALMIQQAREEDQGKYECVARNENGVVHSKAAHIYVKVRRVPPYFTGKLQKVYKVGIGSHLNLTCLAVGYPMPRVFWKRQSDDSFLNDPETAPIGKNVLTLTNVERSENYSCIAVSKLGNIETSTTVEARELLPAPSGFKVVDVADCSVRLAWDPVVSSNPEDPLLGYIVKYRQKLPSLFSSTLTPSTEYAERGGVFKDVKIGGSETKAVIDGLEPYQQYEFVLYAASNLGKGHATLPIEIQTAETLPANPPADVKARPLNSQSVIVQWSPPEVSNGRLISYRIFYTNKEAIDENDKQGWMSKEIKAEELMVTLSSLIPDKTYYIQVQAKNSKGYGPLSKTVTVITKQGVPGQPSKLIAKPVDARRIMLSWEKPLFSYNIIGYTIRFNVSSVETKELRLTSDVQKHTVDGLNPDTLYSFRVAAHSDRGQGAFGDEVLARTLRADALTLPSLKIKAKSSKFIVFNAEDKILNNSLFVVEYRPAQEKFMDDSYEEGVDESEIEGSGMFEGLKWKTSMIDAESGVRIEDLIPNTLYEIRVKSMDNETGDSLFIKTDEDVPSAPRDLEVVHVNASTVKLTWDRPEHENGDLMGYYVFKEKLVNGEPVDNRLQHELVIADANKLYAYISGLEPNTEYAFRVCAFNLHGDGERTPAKKLMTGGMPPSVPRPQSVTMLSDDAPLRARVDWIPPEITYNQPINAYAVFYRPAEKFAEDDFEKIEVPGTQTFAELTKLNMGREYEIRISAGNDDGWSPNATERLITPVGVPDGEPLNVRYDIGEGKLTMQWDPPALDRRNGNISYYRAILTPLDGKSRKIDRNVTDRSTSYVLNAKHGYTFKVAAVTMKGEGPFSPVLNISPYDSALVGPPSNVRVQATSNASAVIQWDFDDTNGAADGFMIKYLHEPVIGQNGRDDTSHWRSQTVMDPKARHLEIVRLNAHKPYAFCVLTIKQSRLGQCSDPPITVDKLKPVFMVENLRVEYKTSQSVSLKWDYNGPQPIKFYLKQSGQKTYFNHHLEEKHLVAPGYEDKIDGNERSFMWSNLRPYMDYTFQIGVTSLKDGTVYWPKEVKVKTDPTGPPFLDIPEFLESRSPGTAQLKLKLATEEHGVISHYWVIVIPSNFSKDDVMNIDSLQLERLTAAVKPSSNLAPIAKKVRKSTIEADDSNEDEMVAEKVKRALEEEAVEAHEYVDDETKMMNSDGIDDDHVKLRVQRYVDPKKPLQGVYVAAQLESNEMRQMFRDERTFTLGDGKNYNGFTNHPLDPNGKYSVMMRAFAKGESNRKAFEYRAPMQEPATKLFTDSFPSEAFSIKGLNATLGKSGGSLWIIAPIICIFIIVCIIGMVMFCWFRSNKKSQRTNRHGSITKVALPTSGFLNSQMNEAAKLLTDAYGRPIPSAYEMNANTMMESSMVDMYPISNGHANTSGGNNYIPLPIHNAPNTQVVRGPIPIGELTLHIERLKMNKNELFVKEFECIDSGEHFTWEASTQVCNSSKNRYNNVVAYDHTRVRLSYTGEEGSDYINANFIDGYRKPKAYIATQGPMPETFADFWRMVWEQNAKTVVMLTKLKEGTRIKCDQYWPNKGRSIYGRIAVTLMDVLDLPHYTMRTIQIEHLDENIVREVKQMQYTAWPDHNVPDHPTPFLMFLKRVKALNQPENTPIICHCSAGIGRTGAFIAIDIMLDRLRFENTVDIFECVTSLRAQRFYMVQTDDQYIFIHDAVLDAAQSGSTEVPAGKLYQHMQRLLQVHGPEQVSDLDMEYRTLCSLKTLNSDCVTANMPVNRSKNRQSQVVPYDKSRVILEQIPSIEGSDYINASWVDGYRQRSAYIATQAPTNQTYEDFWRMLWENDSCIVVMLTKLRELGREKCIEYWPSDPPVVAVGNLNIEAIAEYNMNHYMLREFKVSDAMTGRTRTLRHFQFVDWPEQGVPVRAETFLDFVSQVHKTKSQFGVNGPICVHCFNGGGRTGVFIALATIIDRMNLEHVVDVFTTVKLLRTERPNMVETKDEYQFLWTAALEYLASYEFVSDSQIR